jgi:hypothetical protein
VVALNTLTTDTIVTSITENGELFRENIQFDRGIVSEIASQPSIKFDQAFLTEYFFCD